jgi:hypothetical protein
MLLTLSNGSMRPYTSQILRFMGMHVNCSRLKVIRMLNTLPTNVSRPQSGRSGQGSKTICYVLELLGIILARRYNWFESCYSLEFSKSRTISRRYLLYEESARWRPGGWGRFISLQCIPCIVLKCTLSPITAAMVSLGLALCRTLRRTLSAPPVLHIKLLPSPLTILPSSPLWNLTTLCIV